MTEFIKPKNKLSDDTRAGSTQDKQDKFQLGFYFNQQRCIDCSACIIACKDWHDIPAGPISWMRVNRQEEGRFPNLSVSFLAQPCYHCERPLCAWVCPSEAITKRDVDGVVVVDSQKCREASRCGIISEDEISPEFSFGEIVAPCQAACPAHVHIPAYIALIGKGKFKEALDLIRRQLAIPSVCGRLCSAPCESECRRGDVDEPIAINALKRFVTDNIVEDVPPLFPQTKSDNIAIVGSGPAGLAAAYELVRNGYGVTIFEALPEAGGMLTMCIPQYRLPREVLKRDIDYLKAVGIEIKTNIPIGSELTIDNLFQQGYKAVLLALGASKGQKLMIPGSELSGAITAVAFMRDVNDGNELSLGDRLVVIGGGNVAIDCARTCLRLGVEEVHLICLECRDKMPAGDNEIELAEQEGAVIHPSMTVSRILGKGGEVTGVECFKIKGFEVDDNGIPVIHGKNDIKQILPADMVIFAVGQVPDLSNLNRNGLIELTSLGTIAVDAETLSTNRRGIFAAGDAVHGPTSVIEAIGDGKKAAFYIDRYLQDESLKLHPSRKKTTKFDVKFEVPEDVEKQKRQRMPLLPLEQRKGSFCEVTLGLTPEKAVAEAKRCLNCAGHLCKDVCPYSAPQFGLGPNQKMQKCDFCLDRWLDGKKPVCVTACPVYALDAGPLDKLKAKYGDNQMANGFIYSKDASPSIIHKSR